MPVAGECIIGASLATMAGVGHGRTSIAPPDLRKGPPTRHCRLPSDKPHQHARSDSTAAPAIPAITKEAPPPNHCCDDSEGDNDVANDAQVTAMPAATPTSVGHATRRRRPGTASIT